MKLELLKNVYYGRFARFFALTLALLLFVPLPLSAQRKPGKVTKPAKGQVHTKNHIPPIDGFGGSFKLELDDDEVGDFQPPYQAGGLWVYEHSHPERRIEWVWIWDGNQNPATDLPKKVYSAPPDNACTITITYKDSGTQVGREVVMRGGALRLESEDKFERSHSWGKYRYKHPHAQKKVMRVQIMDGNMNPNTTPARLDYTPPANGKCFIKICYGCH